MLKKGSLLSLPPFGFGDFRFIEINPGDGVSMPEQIEQDWKGKVAAKTTETYPILWTPPLLAFLQNTTYNQFAIEPTTLNTAPKKNSLIKPTKTLIFKDGPGITTALTTLKPLFKSNNVTVCQDLRILLPQIFDFLSCIAMPTEANIVEYHSISQGPVKTFLGDGDETKSVGCDFMYIEAFSGFGTPGSRYTEFQSNTLASTGIYFQEITEKRDAAIELFGRWKEIYHKVKVLTFVYAARDVFEPGEDMDPEEIAQGFANSIIENGFRVDAMNYEEAAASSFPEIEFHNLGLQFGDADEAVEDVIEDAVLTAVQDFFEL